MSSFCFKHKVKKIQNSANTLFFLSGFSFTDTDNSQDSWGREGDHLLFHSTTSTRSRTLRHLFATLHVRWLSRIFNRNACVYQTACYSMRYTTLLNCHLIDWLMMQCLFVYLIELIDSRFLLQRFWHWKPGDLSSHRLSPLYYKWTD